MSKRAPRPRQPEPMKDATSSATDAHESGLPISDIVASASQATPDAMAITRDITPLARTEEALRRSEEKYRSIFETAPSLISAVDAEGILVDCNHRCEDMLGYHRQEMLGQPMTRLLHSAHHARAREVLEEILPREGRHVGDYQMVRKDGAVIDVQINSAAVCNATGQLEGAICVATDVSLQKHALTALRESEERLRRIVENMPVLMIALDDDNRFVFWNRECEIVTGYTAAEMVGNPHALEILYPDPAYRERLLNQWRGRASVFRGWEWELVCKDGYRRTIAWSKIPDDATMPGWASWGVGVDVTSRKQAEERYSILAAALEQAAECIVITDTAGTILHVNPAFERVTGYSRAEVLGENPRILQSGRHDAAFYAEMWKTLTRGQVWTGRLVNRRKDGILFTEEATISPVRDADGGVSHYVGVKRDVTREAELEARLQQSQKMEAMGTLAGGIAHDFNNILYAISGYARLVMDDVPVDSEAHVNLEQVLRGTRRAADLVHKILTFSRQTEHELVPLSLQPVIEEALGLVRASLPATIEVTADVQESCRPVLGDAAQILQVIMNLCANAYQAMGEDSGRLHIGVVEQVIGPEQAAADPHLRPGPHVMLSVSDTGPGIERALLDRIFEPFFTTKPAGCGTGLGLATVHGIVRNHGGSVEVKSAPGQGAEFRILLPVHEIDGARDSAPGTLAPGMIPGNVLYVDDEEMIARLGETALRRSGFTVTSFTNGQEALAAFLAEPGRYDIVVTDLTMPGMTGLELARKIWQTRPEAPVILCTGYSQRIAEEEAQELGFRDFLLKPIDLEDMAGRIRRILAARSQ
jgi:PAS domain S-box-containing protein